jgi:hypothetical protein
VNLDSVNSDPHERARLMIALSGPEGLSNAGLRRAEQSWLAQHLDSCASCREFTESMGAAIRWLRGIPITAGGSLVSMTQTRVRQRAEELRRQQERLWVIWVCCAAVTLCTAVTTAVLWFGVAWLGQQARLPAPVWKGGFVVFWVMPAVLAGMFLLARGTFLADHNGSNQD